MPRSKIKSNELRRATLDGEPEVAINAKLNADTHAALYATARLTDDPAGMSGVIRKALVFYIKHIVRNINTDDPEWEEVRTHIWYARAANARAARNQWAIANAENAAGIARELQRLKDAGRNEEMLTYIEGVLDDLDELSDKAAAGVLDAMKAEYIVRDTMSALDWRKSMREAPADPDDVYEQEATDGTDPE